VVEDGSETDERFRGEYGKVLKMGPSENCSIRGEYAAAHEL
jgi:hypothetical protein